MLQYFAKQERIYPKRVWGKFRKLKWVTMSVMLGIYYLAPFMRWDRGSTAPNQAILIDLEHARAYWFWIEIWPQEVYYLTGLLILAAIGLFFITSILGRVWCGYACPQTVWTDLFVWVERIFQGDRNARKKLREGPWTWDKVRKLTATHCVWFLIAWATAGSFVLYFNDAPTLVKSFLNFDVSPTVLMFIAGLSLSTYIMAGFAREQVCTYMCPYARFQSAMFDKDTLIIGYDESRGERGTGRGKHKKGTSWEGRGDCIDCSACVQVCPMGIDIRDGLQMECIACGLCVDACNTVMDKIDLRRGLIRYDTERMIEARAEGREAKYSWLRLRSVYYVIVMGLVSAVMVYGLMNRSVLDITVLHDRNPVFVQLSNGDIRNGYTLKIQNKTHEHRYYTLSLEGLDTVTMNVKAAGNMTTDNIFVPADSVGSYHIYVQTSDMPAASQPITFVLTANEPARDQDGTVISDQYDSVFITRNDP